MTAVAATARRRGRPRLSEEEKKRHTMTFRMRTELRSAVEEIAKKNGRSLSEQIEHYVENCVKFEMFDQYENGAEPVSPVVVAAVGKLTKLEFRPQSAPAPISTSSAYVLAEELLKKAETLFADIFTAIDHKADELNRENRIMKEQLTKALQTLQKAVDDKPPNI